MQWKKNEKKNRKKKTFWQDIVIWIQPNAFSRVILADIQFSHGNSVSWAF